LPASRSRTERWKDLLDQIASRGGGIEFAIARPASGTGDALGGCDLMWRVRLFEVAPDRLVVECPAAAGKSVTIAQGTPLIAVMAIGQNRWMFHTRTLGTVPMRTGGPAALALALPERVERCARRDFLRVSTASLRLPSIECYPLLEPASVIAADAANRDRIAACQSRGLRLASQDPDLMPNVGPPFRARLMNIGGGGVGLLVTKDDSAAASAHRLLWMRLDLSPHIPAPLAITAKQVHTHIDSEQNLYLGLAFEFAFDPAHREFVVDQIGRYIGLVQAQRQAA
jgi:c-di-GMP-binding flagellar brake protein YcgR